jgi:4-hydroxy-3-polyprenylbenzoate decarboxylase
MIVVPATTASVAGIATGMSKDLIQRAGDVTLKERRPLVLVVREAPLRVAALEHMAALAREGAVILPATPAFYAGAQNVQDLVDFVAGRVLDQCGVEHDLYRRWAGLNAEQADP